MSRLGSEGGIGGSEGESIPNPWRSLAAFVSAVEASSSSSLSYKSCNLSLSISPESFIKCSASDSSLSLENGNVTE